MLIDWFTVAAQAVNFVILVWLLKRYLYGPVLAVIEARGTRIAAELAEADKREALARSQSEELRSRSEALERDREQILKKAASEANTERERLLGMARQESEVLRSRFLASLAAERDAINRELERRAQSELFAMAGKILADLADTSLQERMVTVFTRKLREQRPEFPDSAHQSALVRTAFSLSAGSQLAIEQAIFAVLGDAMRIQFEVVADIVSGIELRIAGHKIAWSVSDYLATLCRNVTAALDSESPRQTEPADAL